MPWSRWCRRKAFRQCGSCKRNYPLSIDVFFESICSCFLPQVLLETVVVIASLVTEGAGVVANLPMGDHVGPQCGLATEALWTLSTLEASLAWVLDHMGLELVLVAERLITVIAVVHQLPVGGLGDPPARDVAGHQGRVGQGARPGVQRWNWGYIGHHVLSLHSQAARALWLCHLGKVLDLDCHGSLLLLFDHLSNGDIGSDLNPVLTPGLILDGLLLVQHNIRNICWHTEGHLVGLSYAWVRRLTLWPLSWPLHYQWQWDIIIILNIVRSGAVFQGTVAVGPLRAEARAVCWPGTGVLGYVLVLQGLGVHGSGLWLHYKGQRAIRGPWRGARVYAHLCYSTGVTDLVRHYWQDGGETWKSKTINEIGFSRGMYSRMARAFNSIYWGCEIKS